MWWGSNNVFPTFFEGFMEYFSTRYGLVTDNDPVTENGQLFLATFLLLCRHSISEDLSWYAASVMREQLYNSRVQAKPITLPPTYIRGLFHRNPDLIDRRIMSHDNMSGIMAFLYMDDTADRFYIWKYLLTHFGTYDNSLGKSKQLSRFLPFNPSNFFVWGLCADSKISFLFYPFYWANLLITCHKPKADTSGKILTLVELIQFRNHWLAKHCWKYFNRKMIEQYGFIWQHELMRLYHGKNSPEFPLRKYLGF